jgi:hypothetical protein
MAPASHPSACGRKENKLKELKIDFNSNIYTRYIIIQLTHYLSIYYIRTKIHLTYTTDTLYIHRRYTEDTSM